MRIPGDCSRQSIHRLGDGGISDPANSVGIWFFIDHPLFDGGGTTLYINVLGDILEEVDWFG